MNLKLERMIGDERVLNWLEEFNSHQNPRRLMPVTRLIERVKAGDYLVVSHVYSGKELGLAFMEQSDWESQVTGVKAAKLSFFAGTDYKVCQTLLADLLPKQKTLGVKWVSCDTQNSPTYHQIALEKCGYHLGSQYIDMKCMVGNHNPRCIVFAKRFNMVFAAPEDAEEVGELARDENSFGRFDADPYLRKIQGPELYVRWAYNSCKGFAAYVLAHKNESGKIDGFVSVRYYNVDKASFDLLRLAENQKGSGLGYALIGAAVRQCVQDNIREIYAGPEAQNNPVKRVYWDAGFQIQSAGLIFHWLLDAEKPQS